MRGSTNKEGCNSSSNKLRVVLSQVDNRWWGKGPLGMRKWPILTAALVEETALTITKITMETTTATMMMMTPTKMMPFTLEAAIKRIHKCIIEEGVWERQRGKSTLVVGISKGKQQIPLREDNQRQSMIKMKIKKYIPLLMRLKVTILKAIRKRIANRASAQCMSARRGPTETLTTKLHT
jgi:hypothetical protein